MANIDEMVAQFIITSSELYAAMPVHSANKLYFLADTEEIYRGNQLFTSSIIFYTEKLPDTGAIRKIYINSETFEGYSWDGTAWVKVITRYNTVNDIITTTPNDSIPTVAAIRKLYNQSITDLSYDYDTNSIKFIQNGIEKNSEITGLLASGVFEPGTNRLIFKNIKGDDAFYVQMEKDNYPIAGYYDESLKAIVLQMRATDEEGNPKELVIPAEDLVDIRISEVEGNLLKEYEDGYGVVLDISKKIDKVDPGKDGRIMTAKEDGNANAINMFVGGSSLSLVDLGDGRQQASPNLLATEAAVFEFVKSLTENIEKILSYTLVQSINREDPSINNYPSESAIAAMWDTIDNSISGLQNQLKTLSESYDEHSDSIASMQDALSGLQTNVEELKTTINTLSELTNQVSSLESTVQEQQQSIDAHQGNISELQLSINGINSSISNLNDALINLTDTHNNDILAINNAISEIENRLSVIDEEIAALNDIINISITNRITSLEEKVEKLSSSEIEYYT